MGKRIDISDELFEQFTKYCNQSDDWDDNLRRGELLGLGGREIRVAPGAIIRVRHPEKIGRNIHIGLYCYINGDLTIEDDVLIGPYCAITAGHHKFDAATGWFSARTEQDYDNTIVIGRGSWLCASVTVTAGVKLGRMNMVCAGAVVTKDTPDCAIMAGAPARQVGRIDPETGEYHWFSREGQS